MMQFCYFFCQKSPLLGYKCAGILNAYWILLCPAAAYDQILMYIFPWTQLNFFEYSTVKVRRCSCVNGVVYHGRELQSRIKPWDGMLTKQPGMRHIDMHLIY